MSSKLRRLVEPLASLKLTVVLFALAIFLVFAGTVAQVDKGIWTIVRDYFRCAVAWIDLQVFFPRAWNVPGRFPFPGGWLIGAALLVNLLAAHMVRFTVRGHGLPLVVGIGIIAVGVGLTWLVLAGALSRDVATTEGEAFWRVLWRLVKGGGVAGITFIGCWLVFQRRAGIVLLHAGVILLLVGELVTGLYAVEGNMRISEGQASNYVYNPRSVELAIIDRSAADYDEVVVVDEVRLRPGERIHHQRLPVDIETIDFMPNSTLANVGDDDPAAANPATRGVGLRVRADEMAPVSGASVSQRSDMPSAYVSFFRKGEDELIGTYLVSQWWSDQAQRLVVDGKTYHVTLRPARTYKPYTLQLIDFRHDRYLGTEIPKDFSSHVRLIDPERRVDRQVRIWMNNPLRYRGETFYQSGYQGENITILQVVRNAGWMIPYVACMFVATGLTVHFMAHLIRFLRRRAAT